MRRTTEEAPRCGARWRADRRRRGRDGRWSRHRSPTRRQTGENRPARADDNHHDAGVDSAPAAHWAQGRNDGSARLASRAGRDHALPRRRSRERHERRRDRRWAPDSSSPIAGTLVQGRAITTCPACRAEMMLAVATSSPRFPFALFLARSPRSSPTLGLGDTCTSASSPARRQPATRARRHGIRARAIACSRPAAAGVA